MKAINQDPNDLNKLEYEKLWKIKDTRGGKTKILKSPIMNKFNQDLKLIDDNEIVIPINNIRKINLRSTVYNQILENE